MSTRELFDALFGPRGESAPLDPDSDRLVDASGGAKIRVRFNPGPADDPMILVFPGEGEVASDYDGAAQILREGEVSLLVSEYRSTGASSGSREAGRLLDDAQMVFEHIKQWRESEGFTGALILMAKSLGTAMAIDVAARRPKEISGLILVSGFSRPGSLLAGKGLPPDSPGISPADGFDNLEKIKALDIPVLIIHGQNDEVVPLLESMTLHQYSPARNKQLVVMPGAGHDDVAEKEASMYYETIIGFALKLAGRRRRRPKRAKRRPREKKEKLKARLQEIEVMNKPF